MDEVGGARGRKRRGNARHRDRKAVDMNKETAIKDVTEDGHDLIPVQAIEPA